MATRILLAVFLAASTLLAGFAQAPQQGGDQFLDGIGETGLVARYVFGDNAEDASRNQFHATLRGTGAEFVDDPQFRRVLLLTGMGSHVELPGRTPFLKRALAAVTADVVDILECGDHTLFIASVNGLILGDDAAPPLLFFGGRYARVDARAPIDKAEAPEFW